jgi:hypothetical protein
MSTRYNNGSHYENHQRAAEIEKLPEHEHRVAEAHQGHSMQLAEHAAEHAHESRQPTVGHGIAAFGHEDIARLARELWEARGRPEGSPDEDWFQAVKELRARSIGH